MNQIGILLATAVSWGAADLLRKAASGGTNSQFLTFVFNLGATLFPLVTLALLFGQKQDVNIKLPDAAIALVAGLLVGIGGILLFSLLGSKETVTTVFPVVRIVSLVVVTLGGVLLFGEQMTPRLGLGLVLSFVSIYLILAR